MSIHIQGDCLCATREPTGYLTEDGRLVLDNARYRRRGVCAGCGARAWTGWYTGHGDAIRWFCDDCAGVDCQADKWDELRYVYERGRLPEIFCPGPRQIIAPARLQPQKIA